MKERVVGKKSLLTNICHFKVMLFVYLCGINVGIKAGMLVKGKKVCTM